MPPSARSQSKLFVSELEDGVRAVERYVSALDREIQQRAELIEQLERSEIYYETQRTDAKVVAVVSTAGGGLCLQNIRT